MNTSVAQSQGTQSPAGASASIFACPKDSLCGAVVPGILPTVVAGIGFFAVHRLSLRRQKRTEVNDHCNRVFALVSEALEAAEEAWAIDGANAQFGDRVRKVKRLVHRLSGEITSLNMRCSSINVPSEIVAFRKAATEDLDDPGRLANANRASQISAAALELNRAISSQFNRLYD